MQITLARIDDQLIHGQITTAWSKVTDVWRIIICNDDVFNGKVCRALLRQAASPGMKINIISLEEAVVVYCNPQYWDEAVFYLFTNPHGVLTMVRQGAQITMLNIGGMAWRLDKKQLTGAVSLDLQDIQVSRGLDKLGIELDLYIVVSDPLVNALNKINKTAFCE